MNIATFSDIQKFGYVGDIQSLDNKKAEPFPDPFSDSLWY
jgi:hypothetical protein